MHKRRISSSLAVKRSLIPGHADDHLTGGIAGCVVACRLAEAFPEWDIVLVEAGEDSKDDETIARERSSSFRSWASWLTRGLEGRCKG